jgi:hypothetical protein
VPRIRSQVTHQYCYSRSPVSAACCLHRPAQDATPDDWQQLASRAAVSMFTISGLAAKPAGYYFVSVTADQILLGAAAQPALQPLSQVCRVVYDPLKKPVSAPAATVSFGCRSVAQHCLRLGIHAHC